MIYDLFQKRIDTKIAEADQWYKSLVIPRDVDMRELSIAAEEEYSELIEIFHQFDMKAMAVFVSSVLSLVFLMALSFDGVNLVATKILFSVSGCSSVCVFLPSSRPKLFSTKSIIEAKLNNPDLNVEGVTASAYHVCSVGVQEINDLKSGFVVFSVFMLCAGMATLTYVAF